LCNHKNCASAKNGFTLIELSIVLVIIGLIVGGVLVGQNLIRAAEVRGTITQVEKFNTATNTFRGKFNALPGDMNAATAATFGFTPRGTSRGEGDGNGILEGVNASSPLGIRESTGETVMFWVDLSSAAAGKLIEGGFNTASPATDPSADVTGTNLNLYLPQAKLGHNNYWGWPR
jgi:prepilin-type N-terminal cleavage/methylation domain-containing protein